MALGKPAPRRRVGCCEASWVGVDGASLKVRAWMCVCVCVCVYLGVGWVLGAVQIHFVIINNKKIQSEVRSAKRDNKPPRRALRFS